MIIDALQQPYPVDAASQAVRCCPMRDLKKTQMCRTPVESIYSDVLIAHCSTDFVSWPDARTRREKKNPFNRHLRICSTQLRSLKEQRVR